MDRVNPGEQQKLQNRDNQIEQRNIKNWLGERKGRKDGL